jgi:hypothetical protein
MDRRSRQTLSYLIQKLSGQTWQILEAIWQKSWLIWRQILWSTWFTRWFVRLRVWEQSRLQVLEPTFFANGAEVGGVRERSLGSPTHPLAGPPRRLAAQGGKGELCTALSIYILALILRLRLRACCWKREEEVLPAPRGRAFGLWPLVVGGWPYHCEVFPCTLALTFPSRPASLGA